MIELRLLARECTCLVTTAFRMVVEDYSAFQNNVSEKLRQAGAPKLLQACFPRRERRTLPGDHLADQGDFRGAVDVYRSVRGSNRRQALRRAKILKERLGEFDANRSASGRLNRRAERPYCNSKNDLKVLWFINNSIPYTKSGYTVRTHESLKALVNVQVQVVAATRLAYPLIVGTIIKQKFDSIDRVPYFRLIPWVYPKSLMKRSQKAVSLLDALTKEIGPLLLHTTTDFRNATIVAQVAQANNIPWIYEVRGELENTWLSRLDEDIRISAEESEFYGKFRSAETRSMKLADAVVVLSEVSRRNLEARGIDSKKIFVIPNAIDERYLDFDFDKAKIRQELGLDPTDQIVGTVTSVVKYEGLQLAIEALVHDSGDWKLLIVGDGVDLPRLRAIARELNVEHRVIFAGRKSGKMVWKWYAALDIFIVPREDVEVCRNVTPIKPLMAMAFGIPVVSSDLPALREVIGTGGVYFRPGSPQAFLEAIKEAVSNPKLGTQGRKLASNRTWNANARKYQEMYQTVL